MLQSIWGGGHLHMACNTTTPKKYNGLLPNSTSSQMVNLKIEFPKMAKKTLTGPGLEPETSGLTYHRSSHLSYPALWMVAVPNSQLVFARVLQKYYKYYFVQLECGMV